AVAVNTAKQPLFTLAERVALIKQAVSDPKVDVRSFEGLLADFARAAGAAVIVRGLRAVSDFEYEFQMALMNRNLAPGIETVFLVPAFDLTYLSSSLVREVARFGGNVLGWWKSWGGRFPLPPSPASSGISAPVARTGFRTTSPRAPRSITRSRTGPVWSARGSPT